MQNLNYVLDSVNSQMNNKTSTATINTDFDIFNVGNTINSSNFVYDGQTTLLINSSLNQSSNLVQLTYFNPVTGLTGNNASGFSDWSFDLVASNYLNGVFTSSYNISQQTTLYSNLENNGELYLNTYNLDISNNGETNLQNTMFFSLTQKPYSSYQGFSYNDPSSQGAPTWSNVNPYYSTTDSSNYLFQSCYYKGTQNEIICVDLSFSIQNTETMNIESTSGTPTLSVSIKNTVFTKEMLASIGSGTSFKPKVYTAGPIPLNFTANGQTFNSRVASSFMYNSIPLIIADGYDKVYVTLPVIHVPPTTEKKGQYLVANDLVIEPLDIGYYIDPVNNNPTANLNTGITTVAGTSEVIYGHFVIGVSFSQNTNVWVPGTRFYSQILIKNIWRSPIAIYNSYEAFSLNDMATKLVVLLFGKNSNGGTFLVTNTGTPLNTINNYSVTSLGNFMTIMKGIIQLYNNSYSLVDYFINPSAIEYLNDRGYNAKVCILQPLLDGGISNPPTLEVNPNMQYLLLNANNSSNLSMDPISQLVFNQGINYFNLNNSVLSATGLLNYKDNELEITTTDSNNLFGNSMYLGLQKINSQNFYVLIILPEALFNVRVTENDNLISLYSTPSSLFYLNVNANSSSQFSPSSDNRITSSNYSQFNSVNSVTTQFQLTKLNLTVSSEKII